eukprot:GHVT01006316.1.p1 GENE.GHVT01006316.1~~GHVT01006316.1.p1  ORF type:complete len:301 (-),score=67.58 GHVT01006316.1:308-1210(-)
MGVAPMAGRLEVSITPSTKLADSHVSDAVSSSLAPGGLGVDGSSTLVGGGLAPSAFFPPLGGLPGGGLSGSHCGPYRGAPLNFGAGALPLQPLNVGPGAVGSLGPQAAGLHPSGGGLPSGFGHSSVFDGVTGGVFGGLQMPLGAPAPAPLSSGMHPRMLGLHPMQMPPHPPTWRPQPFANAAPPMQPNPSFLPGALSMLHGQPPTAPAAAPLPAGRALGDLTLQPAALPSAPPPSALPSAPQIPGWAELMQDGNQHGIDVGQLLQDPARLKDPRLKTRFLALLSRHEHIASLFRSMGVEF